MASGQEDQADLGDSATQLAPRPSDATLTVTKAARLLGVHPNTIRAWSDRGRLRFYRINQRGDRRYRLGDLQRFLAAALDAPVGVAESASEGGAWGIAVLASFTASGGGDLTAYLDDIVFAGADAAVVSPDVDDVSGFAEYLARYEAGLEVQRRAIAALTMSEGTAS